MANPLIRKFLMGLLAIVIAVVGIVMVLSSENALLVHPKGIIARHQLILIITNIFLMLIIILPTYLFLFGVVWYCLKKTNQYNPDHSFGPMGEVIMWGFPSIIVVILGLVTWEATYKLDPYKPLESEFKTLNVQVVALDWKWLFIYPDLGIATLNYLQIPERTSIHLRLTADESPMNSFWIPQLSGQIYSMTGMSTQLHLMADGAGEYAGRAVEINGEGYSGMTFAVKSTSQKDFDDWTAKVKQSPLHLTKEAYTELVKRSINRSIMLFSEVEKDLYQQIIHKYMHPTHSVL